MKKSSNKKEGRLPGFPANLLLFFNRLTIQRFGSVPLHGLKYRFLALMGGLVLVLAVLVGGGGEVPDTDPVPHVAEIAPTLSLPLELNSRVERWMERYLTDQRPAFERYLAREGLYSGMIKEALQRRGMPPELLYLAAVESGFSPRAISRVSASGLWQFMGPTARAFGLRIDGWVDERRDPVRATEAALDYLQSLYDQFGSWYLAAAAYNAGPGRVARAVRNHGGEDTAEGELYWEIVEHLPRETRAYVPKMLAAVLLAQAAGDYGFRVERMAPVRYERVWVPGSTSLRAVARAADVPVQDIRDLNPHLVRGVTPPVSLFPVRVPPGRSPAVVASLGSRWERFHVDD